MPKAQPQPAHRMRDLLSQEVMRREYVVGVIREVALRKLTTG